MEYINFRRSTYALTSNSTLICYTLQYKLKTEFRILPKVGITHIDNSKTNGKYLNRIIKKEF